MRKNKTEDEALLSKRDRERLDYEQTVPQRRTFLEAAIVRAKGFSRDRSPQFKALFVSLATLGGRKEDQRRLRPLADELQNAGIGVILDRWDNPAIGSNLARFISRD